MKWMIISIIVLCVTVLSGCTENANHYGGIKKTDFPEMSDPDLEFVHEFRGHSDNWGALFFVYKKKDSDKRTIKQFLVYNGKDPKPTGEISFDYDAGDEVGSGGMTTTEVPENTADDFRNVTISIHEQSEQDERRGQNGEDGFMLSGPASSRMEALRISNELMSELWQGYVFR